MFVDMQQFAKRIFRRQHCISPAREIAPVVDLMKRCVGGRNCGSDGDESEGVIAVEAGFAPGVMCREISLAHRVLQQANQKGRSPTMDS
ncbi:hypothetical protein D9M68_916820 [compost metagenome]